MSNFISRRRFVPSDAYLLQLERIVLVDGVPVSPVTGVGTGTLLLVGEFEDGVFDTPTEVFGAESEQSLFGGFGYTYGNTRYQNPCARRHLGENWNGNGFIKGKYLEPNRKIITRVDTSVGEVQFSLVAGLVSNVGPFTGLATSDILTIDVDSQVPQNSTAITATKAQKDSSPAVTYPLTTPFVDGERIGITIDNLAEVIVTMQAADDTLAEIIARINAAFGSTVAVDNSGQLRIESIQQGSGASVTLRDVDTGALAKINMNATPATGSGNVANLVSVTATEVVALITGAGLSDVSASVTSDGRVLVYRDGSTTGTILISATSMATAMGFTTNTTITADEGVADTIAAGTRVRNSGGDEWVVMVTTAIPAGTATAPSTGTYNIKVRPATDDGTASGASANTVNVVVDQPTNRYIECDNPQALTAALTDSQIDAKYQTAFDATLPTNRISRIANHSLCARRSDSTVQAGQRNATSASDEGCYGRKFHTRAPFGYTPTAAITDVASYRIDRVFYTYPGFNVTIPEIAELGAAGGTGFTETGEILIGSDGPLAYINCYLNPEENPCQDTKLLDFVNSIEEPSGFFQTESQYIAFKEAGICAPKVDIDGNIVFQSEVTAELTPGRKTQKRRKMADYIQDSIAIALLPFSKKLRTVKRSAGIDSAIESFLADLVSEDNPDFQRIQGYSFENVTSENPTLAQNGVSVRKIQVEMIPSEDSFLVLTEIGETVEISEV